MHELAHAVRLQQGKIDFSTPERERREEVMARVFSGLMLARLTGPLGVAELERQIAHSQSDNYTYEGAGPLRAAVELARSPGFAALTPAQLLDKAEQLTDTHDLTRNMSAEQRQSYATYLNTASKEPGDIAARQRRVAVSPSPTEAFVDLAKATSGNPMTRYTYLPEMGVYDAQVLNAHQQDLALRREQQGYNPFVGPALKGLLQGEKPADKVALQELVEFSKMFSHADCSTDDFLPTPPAAETAAKAPAKAKGRQPKV